MSTLQPVTGALLSRSATCAALLLLSSAALAKNTPSVRKHSRKKCWWVAAFSFHQCSARLREEVKHPCSSLCRGSCFSSLSGFLCALRHSSSRGLARGRCWRAAQAAKPSWRPDFASGGHAPSCALHTVTGSASRARSCFALSSFPIFCLTCVCVGIDSKIPFKNLVGISCTDLQASQMTKSLKGGEKSYYIMWVLLLTFDYSNLGLPVNREKVCVSSSPGAVRNPVPCWCSAQPLGRGMTCRAAGRHAQALGDL